MSGSRRDTYSPVRYRQQNAVSLHWPNLLMAAAASRPDVQHNTTEVGDAGVRARAGLSGFGLSGSLTTLMARSQAGSIGIAAYGAKYSLYRTFLSRGKDVVFPKDTPMEIGFDAPHK